GHFIARLPGQGAAGLLDPFTGGVVIGEAACHALLRRALGPDATPDPAHLRAVTTAEIVLRMLANLKVIYPRRGDWPRALRTVEARVALQPEAPDEVRDR